MAGQSPYCLPLAWTWRPEEVAAANAEREGFVFLDSAMILPEIGRWSFLAWEPMGRLLTRGPGGRVGRPGRWQEHRGDPFQLLAEVLSQYSVGDKTPAGASPDGELPPFRGGLAGYLSYDLGRMIERLPALTRDDLGLPDLSFGLYDWVLAYDGRRRAWWLAGTGFDPASPRSPGELAERMTVPVPREGAPPGETPPAEGDRAGSAPRSNFTRDAYLSTVSRVREYIFAGDIYQANLSQRFEGVVAGRPWAFYEKLRRRNPAPFAAYLNFPEGVVASSSPERFLQVRGAAVESRPIKGTRPRGREPAEDARLRQELWESEKDRAELAMIVDLVRNDLGRVCRPGTVRVPELYRLEGYATVWHLVATVVGELRAGMGIPDLLRAAFPGGSITGAPKIRAMEIIEELEPTRRGVYTGSIGYIGFDGTSDLNIAIRTVLLRDGRAYYQVGGGIVADSEPEAEYRETLAKGQAIWEVLSGVDGMGGLQR